MVGAGRLDGPGMNPSLLMYVLASLVIVPRAVYFLLASEKLIEQKRKYLGWRIAKEYIYIKFLQKHIFLQRLYNGQ
jgi:hypothetical protein